MAESMLDQVADKEHFTERLGKELEAAYDDIRRHEDSLSEALREKTTAAAKLLMPMTKLTELLNMQRIVDTLRNEMLPLVAEASQSAQVQIGIARVSILNYNKLNKFSVRWNKRQLWQAFNQWLSVTKDGKVEVRLLMQEPALKRIVKKWANLRVAGAFEKWYDEMFWGRDARHRKDEQKRKEFERVRRLTKKAEDLEVLRVELSDTELMHQKEIQNMEFQHQQELNRLQAELQKLKMDKWQIEQHAADEKARLVTRCREEATKVRRVQQGDERRKEQLMKRILNRMTRRAMAEMWETWTAMVAEKRRLRAVMGRVLGKIRNLRLGAAMDKWLQHMEAQKSHKQQDKHREARIKRAIMKMLQRQQAEALYGWDEAVRAARTRRTLLQRALLRMRLREISTAFHTWLETMQQNRWQRSKMLQIVNKMMRREVSLAFDAWLEHTGEMQRVRKLLQRAVSRMTLRALGMAFDRWVESTKDTQTMRNRMVGALTRMSYAQLFGAFNQWAGWTQETISRRNLLKKVLLKMQNMLAHQVLNRWQESAREAKRLRHVANRVITRMTKAALRVAFDDWLQFTDDAIHAREEELRRQQEILRRAIVRMMQLSLSRAWQTWTGFVEEMREVKRKGLQVLMRMQRRLEVQVFRAWDNYIKELTEEYERKLELARGFLNQLVRGGLYRCYCSWVEAILHKREVLEKFGLKLINRHLVAILNTWFEVAENYREVKKHLRGVLVKMGKGTLMRACNQWKEVVGERKQLRHKARVIIFRMQNQAMVAAFSHWAALLEDLRRDIRAKVMDDCRVRFASSVLLQPLLDAATQILDFRQKYVHGRAELDAYRGMQDHARATQRAVEWVAHTGVEELGRLEAEVLKSERDAKKPSPGPRKAGRAKYGRAQVDKAIQEGGEIVNFLMRKLGDEADAAIEGLREKKRELAITHEKQELEKRRMMDILRSKLVSALKEGEEHLNVRLRRLVHKITHSNIHHWLQEAARSSPVDADAQFFEDSEEKLPLVAKEPEINLHPAKGFVWPPRSADTDRYASREFLGGAEPRESESSREFGAAEEREREREMRERAAGGSRGSSRGSLGPHAASEVLTMAVGVGEMPGVVLDGGNSIPSGHFSGWGRKPQGVARAGIDWDQHSKRPPATRDWHPSASRKSVLQMKLSNTRSHDSLTRSGYQLNRPPAVPAPTVR